MTGWTIISVVLTATWLCVFAVVWLLCWAAARADPP